MNKNSKPRFSYHRQSLAYINLLYEQLQKRAITLEEKKRIISQMSAGEITREECQHMLENIKEVAKLI